jgi:hypothetical protein
MIEEEDAVERVRLAVQTANLRRICSDIDVVTVARSFDFN